VKIGPLINSLRRFYHKPEAMPVFNLLSFVVKILAIQFSMLNGLIKPKGISNLKDVQVSEERGLITVVQF
jgi:hypothetical protein